NSGKLKEKVVEAQEALRLRAFVLRVEEEEGWNVAAKIPRPTSGERLDKTKGVNFGSLVKKLLFCALPTTSTIYPVHTPISRAKPSDFPKPGPNLPKLVIQQQYAHQNLEKEARQVINFFETKAATHEGDYTQEKRKTSTTKLMNDSDQDRKVVVKIHEPQPALQFDVGSESIVGEGDYSFGGAGCNNKKELSRKARAMAKNAVSPFYKAKSEKYWSLYKEFCKRFEINEEEPSEDGLLAFIVWLDISGMASQTSQIIQVVVNNLWFEGKEDFRKSLAVTQ
ncbi:6241_t:CDS:2, partial [Gigaspora rosea]